MAQVLTIIIGSIVIATAPEHAQGILGALQHAKVYDKGWTGEFSQKDEAIEFGFADESKFIAKPEPLKAAQEDAARNSTRWLEEYREHQATKAKLKEAETKLARIADAQESA